VTDLRLLLLFALPCRVVPEVFLSEILEGKAPDGVFEENLDEENLDETTEREKGILARRGRKTGADAQI
jgi:hypothetical protein